MSTLNTFEINPFNGGSNSWNWNGGVNSYEGIGANLHFEPVKGMKSDIAYVVTSEHNLRIGERNSEVYLTDNTLFSDAISEGDGDKNNHQVNAKIEYEPDTLNRLVFRAQFNRQVGDKFSGSLTQNFFEKDSILNSGVTLNRVSSGDQKFISKLHWTRKSKKKSE